MVSSINDLFNQLLDIKKYIIKLNKNQRKSNLGQNKLLEARELHTLYLSELELVCQKLRKGEISKDTYNIIDIVSKNFLCTYKEINDLCEQGTETEIINMEDFNLKTACTLLPVMTGDEKVTQQLIDNIQLYNDMLKDSHKSVLINFVLKSRLSNSAKLRLSQKYDSVADLLLDMKQQLLTQKSAASLQVQLQKTRQNNKSIDAYGAEIESLFVDLTISQSKNDEKLYKILQPINEQVAVKRFADGLRDTRLSTIIAARNYSSLNEAVRAAKDEELSAAPASSGVGFVMQRGQARGKYRSSYIKPNFNRSPQQNQRSFTNNNRRPHRGTGNYQRGNFNRGKYYTGRYNKNSPRINHMTTNDESQNVELEASLNHFFRA